MKTATEVSPKHQLPPTQHIADHNTKITALKTKVQGAAEWTPTFLKVTGKGVVGVGRRGRWQRFGRIV